MYLSVCVVCWPVWGVLVYLRVSVPVCYRFVCVHTRSRKNDEVRRNGNSQYSRNVTHVMLSDVILYS